MEFGIVNFIKFPGTESNSGTERFKIHAWK